MSTKAKSATKNTPDQTYDTGGLYGNAKSGKTGTTYDPSDFESELVSTAQGGLNQYIQQYLNPTYDSATYQARVNALNNQATKSFENNVINNLASRGLTRGSSVNQMSNEFGNTLTDAQNALMASEDENNLNKINAMLGLYTTPYNLMTGLSGVSSNAYNNLLNANQSKNNQNAANNASLWNAAMGGASALGAAALMPAPAPMASDIRMKENLEFISEVDDIAIYRFDYINGSKDQIGVIAQEMQEQCPESVIEHFEGDYMGVDYSKLPERVQNKIQELRGEQE